VQCKKCLGFCLFGVYAMDGVKVRVAHPRNCKNNCPACARVCPQAAIIFPKCKDSPINGDDVQPGAAGGTSVNIDLDAIVGASDLYAALRQRGAGLPDAPPPERPEPASAGGAGRQSKEPR
jgi:NAD-dependent dihydropyrimidine dehydrogenase PreA subunit